MQMLTEVKPRPRPLRKTDVPERGLTYIKGNRWFFNHFALHKRMIRAEKETCSADSRSDLEWSFNAWVTFDQTKANETTLNVSSSTDAAQAIKDNFE
jgi:hypothetical protein